MKANELKQSDIHIGLRIKSLVSDTQGEVVFIDINDDYFSYVKWDDKPYATTGFYGTDLDCEVVQCANKNVLLHEPLLPLQNVDTWKSLNRGLIKTNTQSKETVWLEWCCVQSAELFRKLEAFARSAALKFQPNRKK